MAEGRLGSQLGPLQPHLQDGAAGRFAQCLPSVKAEADSVPAAPLNPRVALAFSPYAFIKHLYVAGSVQGAGATEINTGVSQEADRENEVSVALGL